MKKVNKDPFFSGSEHMAFGAYCCEKLIPHYGDFNMDNQGVIFCAKCYDKLFKKGGNNA